MKPSLIITSTTYPVDEHDTRPRFVHDLAKRLVGEWDVTVLCPSEKNKPRTYTLDGVKVIRFRYAPNSFEMLTGSGAILETLRKQKLAYLLLPLFLISQYLYLLTLCLKTGTKVINAHWGLPQGLIALAVKKTLLNRLRVATTLHGADVFDLKEISFLKNITWNGSDHLFVASETMKAELKSHGIPSDSVTVRAMGIDSEKMFTPGLQAAPANRVLYVGRLAEKKGVEILIKALSILKKQDVFVNCTIVGNGRKQQELLSLAKTLELEDHTTFIEGLPHKDLKKVYNAHGVFVFPSIIAASGDREGLGLTPIEAMACGCVVVASNLPTSKEYVTDKENGFLFKAGDPQDLASVIRRVINMETVSLNNLRDQAIVRARDNYSWSATTASYCQRLNELTTI